MRLMNGRKDKTENTAGHGRTRLIVLIVSVVLLLLIPAGSTLSYVKHTSDGVANEFSAAAAPPLYIDETFDGQTKSNVKVRLDESGSGRYYVRAAIVITMLDDSGNTVAKLPVSGTDYTISMGSDWTKNGNYWYYNKTLAPGQSTTNLIQSCVTRNNAYQLSVKVAAQTVQANPADAVTEAWGLTPTVSE